MARNAYLYDRSCVLVLACGVLRRSMEEEV